MQCRAGRAGRQAGGQARGSSSSTTSRTSGHGLGHDHHPPSRSSCKRQRPAWSLCNCEICDSVRDSGSAPCTPPFLPPMSDSSDARVPGPCEAGKIHSFSKANSPPALWTTLVGPEEVYSHCLTSGHGLATDEPPPDRSMFMLERGLALALGLWLLPFLLLTFFFPFSLECALWDRELDRKKNANRNGKTEEEASLNGLASTPDL